MFGVNSYARLLLLHGRVFFWDASSLALGPWGWPANALPLRNSGCSTLEVLLLTVAVGEHYAITG